MNRDARYALSQELEAKQTLLDQLRALATNHPDFLIDLLEGETNLLELIAALDASIVDDETLVDGAKAAPGQTPGAESLEEAGVDAGLGDGLALYQTSVIVAIIVLPVLPPLCCRVTLLL